MTYECCNDCIDKLLITKQLSNRPGLSRIDYRIGTYRDILEALHHKLNQTDELVGWTHREVDDPGIALLEGASILGDILTFYQEVYANEAYLRTAQWRESIADLVRLLGYRLSPGLGGKAAFAFEVKGDKPVVIPAGFSMKALLEEQAKPVDFETIAESKAFPYLSAFHLYRPRLSAKGIKKGSNRLEVASVTVSGEDFPSYDVESIGNVKIQASDRLILIPSGEILIVKGVQQLLDRTMIEIEGSLTSNYETSVIAYRIGRSFRHFGHNAPAKYTYLDKDSPPQAIQDNTSFRRWFGVEFEHPQYDIFLSSLEMPLDQPVDNLAVGNTIICQGVVEGVSKGVEIGKDSEIGKGAKKTDSYGAEIGDNTTQTPFTQTATIAALRVDSLSWGNLSGPSTVLTLESPLCDDFDISNSKPEFDIPSFDPSELVTGDIRRFQFHEVKSPALRLRALTEWDERPSELHLNFWGTYDEAKNLAGRRLSLKKEGVEPLQVSVTTTCESFEEMLESDHRDETHPWQWPICVDKELDGFLLEDFNEENPNVTVYGNLVDATQGKSEKEAVLGNGDNREPFQTFKLPKAPLTYFISKDETPPEVPELQVYVNERRWTRVPSFFGHGPKEQIYIVREDDKNNSWVQFGDGKTGSRLPSGVHNVTAIYRTSTGATGFIKAGTTAPVGQQLEGLRKVHLPGEAFGGSEPESGEDAKGTAPGKVQSLGRLVSLQDFEYEARALPGVVKAKARWDIYVGSAAVVVILLTKSGPKTTERQELEKVLNQANHDRGSRRFPIIVRPGVRHYIYLTVSVGYDATYKKANLKEEIKIALGVTGEEEYGIDGSNGLFGAKYRQFGQPEYATRIEGTIQQVKGMVWAKVDSMGFKRGDIKHPAQMTSSKNLEPSGAIVNDSMQMKHQPSQVLLTLHSSHLLLKFAQIEPTEVGCHG